MENQCLLFPERKQCHFAYDKARQERKRKDDIPSQIPFLPDNRFLFGKWGETKIGERSEPNAAWGEGLEETEDSFDVADP